MYLIKVDGTNTSISLSEQQLLSCVNGPGYQSIGCNGGIPREALNYVAARNQTRLSLWPYTGTKGLCNRNNRATNGNTVKLGGKATRFDVNYNEQVRRRS